MSDTIKKWHEMQEEKQTKYITEELIEQKMISYGYGETNSHDEDHIRKIVLDHFDAEITDQWQQIATTTSTKNLQLTVIVFM